MSTRTAEAKIPRGIVAAAALAILCWFVLFHNLGAPALMEPDEGRNAEVAREILLLGDWITPHYDFIPYLDKPMFFYWLAAAAYKLFGVSEFSARLPSALAALGCVLLVYDLGRRFAGRWAGLWSGLVLSTSPAFMAFSRAVIFDMTLAFFITLALWAFERGRAAAATRATKFFLVMYAAAAGAVLAKGPIGLAIPALVIGAYWLVRRRQPPLGAMKPLSGAAIVLLIAAPWYLWAEARNPGYLHYFFVEENFLRYLTPRFNRGQPWYFYLEVLAIGFLPWTTMLQLPFTRASELKNEDRLFILLWVAVPFIFFSFSAAKQPGYILPAFPPLALLVGTAIARALEMRTAGSRRPLAVPWLVLLAAIGYFTLALFLPSLLPPGIADAAAGVPPFITRFSWPLVPMLLVLLLVTVAASLWASPARYYVATCVFFSAFHIFGLGVFSDISRTRSSKDLVEEALPLIRPDDQPVVYSDYLSSLPFYLKAEKPLWVVLAQRGGAVMGSFYMAEKNPRPVRGAGEAVLSFDKFAELWNDSPARLIVFVEEKKLPRLAADVGAAPKRLLTVGDMAVVANR
jgi:4-amino-4-deoxy-L-arabinose transferase-like glycosyltransferase